MSNVYVEAEINFKVDIKTFVSDKTAFDKDKLNKQLIKQVVELFKNDAEVYVKQLYRV